MSDDVGWAVRLPDGHTVVEIGPDVSEKLVWSLALGWPSTAEVARAVAAGARAYRCRVVEIPPGA